MLIPDFVSSFSHLRYLQPIANNVIVLNPHCPIATASDFQMPVWRTIRATRSQSPRFSWLILPSMEKILRTTVGRGTRRHIMKMDTLPMHLQLIVITTISPLPAHILQTTVAMQRVPRQPQPRQSPQHLRRRQRMRHPQS